MIKRFTTRNRQKAWARWLTFKAARSWLALATGHRGDWYWTLSEEYAELRRRKCIDQFGRKQI